jgi:hypothetical protein
VGELHNEDEMERACGTQEKEEKYTLALATKTCRKQSVKPGCRWEDYIVINLKYDGRLTIGLIWPRIGTTDLFFWWWQWTTEFHKMQSFS